MSDFTLPPIGELPSSGTKTRAQVLDILFEPSPQLHTLSLDLLHMTTFDSYDDLVARIRIQLTDLAESPSSSDTQWLDTILGAHPRLGSKKVESTQSQLEQAGLKSGDNEGVSELQALNLDYERTFPGLIFVSFVNGRPRSVVMDEMRRRIARGDMALERKEAIEAMCKIAADRTAKLLIT